VSLHYYPHEDLQIKPRVRPEGLEPSVSDYVAIAIINLTLVMVFVSFAINGGVIGSLVALVAIAGFNILALRRAAGAPAPDDPEPEIQWRDWQMRPDPREPALREGNDGQNGIRNRAARAGLR
jgi:hypothetical protein